MTKKASDIDYSLSRVPEEGKQSFWRILLIRIGSLCCVSQLMLGAALGMGMTFMGALLATLLGSVLLQVVSWALGTAAAREGLSTSLLSRWCGLGKGGSAVFGAVVAISMVGWFGVQNSVFGEGMASIITLTDGLGNLEFPFWAIITGLAITIIVVFGIKAIADLAAIFVPLFVAAVIYAAIVMLQSFDMGTLLTMQGTGAPLTLGAATTMVTGGFIAGSICTPDYSRFLKDGKQVFWMTLIGTFLGELGMNLIAVLLAHATGSGDVVTIMMAMSGILGVIIVVASTVKLNDINLYSSSLGLATSINALFDRKVSRDALVWTLGIVGTFLSVIGIINYFTSFLSLLGVAIPPVAGIMVVDYFLLRRNRKALDDSRARGELPTRVENWNPVALICWVVGFGIGEVSSLLGIGIPGLNSLVLGGLIYYVVMKLMARSRKVEHVIFAETDQVL